MVSGAYNSRVNNRFRKHNDVPMTLEQKLSYYLDQNDQYMQEFINHLRRNDIDIDFFGYDSGSLGYVDLTDQVRTPIMITDVLATWIATPTFTQSVEGSIATPASNTIIVHGSGVPFTGLYQIEWSVGIEAAAATLADNMKLEVTSPSLTISNSLNGTAIGDYPQETQIVSLTKGQIPTIASDNTETTATYSAQMTVTSIAGTATLTIGDRTLYLPYEDGQFQALGMHGMQSDIHKQYNLVVSPVSACSLEIMGYADYRKIDQ